MKKQNENVKNKELMPWTDTTRVYLYILEKVEKYT